MSNLVNLFGIVAQTCAVVGMVVQQQNNNRRGSYIQRKNRVSDWWATSWGRLVRSSDVADPVSAYS